MERKHRHLVLMLVLTLVFAMGGPGVLSESHGSTEEATFSGHGSPSLLPDAEGGPAGGDIWIPIPGPEPPATTPAKAVHPPLPEPARFDIPRPPFTKPSVPTRGGVEVPTIVPKVDVTFCLDTTGSMSDEIEVAKAQILNIAAIVEAGTPKPHVRYALVIFRDIGDDYVTQVFDFMPVAELSDILQTVEARGGGDYAESVSEALHRSVHDVMWDLDASCAVYLIGDAPPHLDYDNGFSHVQAATDAADLGIMINAIGCSGIRGSETEFQQVAEMTGGAFVYLTYDSASSFGSTGWGPCGPSGGDTGGGAGSGSDGDVETDSGEGSGCGSGSGGGQSQSNDLDEVLTGMIQGQARSQGVEYEGDGDG